MASATCWAPRTPLGGSVLGGAWAISTTERGTGGRPGPLDLRGRPPCPANWNPNRRLGSPSTPCRNSGWRSHPCATHAPDVRFVFFMSRNLILKKALRLGLLADISRTSTITSCQMRETHATVDSVLCIKPPPLMIRKLTHHLSW